MRLIYLDTKSSSWTEKQNLRIYFAWMMSLNLRSGLKKPPRILQVHAACTLKNRIGNHVLSPQPRHGAI